MEVIKQVTDEWFKGYKEGILNLIILILINYKLV